MKITTDAAEISAVVGTKVARLTLDIEEGEKRAKQLEPEAERSESTKKALAAINAGIDRAKKLRASLAMIERSVIGFNEASIELNDNESAVFGYVENS